jgi:N-acetylmuramoyl-L-alanine amidase
MRSFASAIAAVVTLACAAPVLLAQSSQPQRLYNEALARDAALRREMDALRPGTPTAAVLQRVRVLVTSFEDFSRLFPTSGYSDNALWQGATLSAAAYWQFGEPDDRDTALALLDDLAARFPTSSLVKQIPAQVKRLKGAAPPAPVAIPAAPPPARPVPVAPAPAAAPRSATVPPESTATAPAGPTAALRSIRREVLADALRITLELDREIPFYHEQIDAPARIFVDLRNTAAIRSLRGATIKFPDDVVTQVRIGLHLGARTRVVLDLTGTRRYSVYPLYNPFRVVIDVERASAAARSAAAALSAAQLPAAAVPRGAAAPPAAASANSDGGFSLSRQLGLGIARIVIDPGHGGQDPGARSRGLTEAALVLDVALRLEKLLLKEAGVEVVLTRRTDTYVPLEERTALANRARADLFLSIHVNASTNASARGVETYFLNFAPDSEAEAIAARENAGSSGQMRQLPDIVRAIALNNKIDESRDFATILQSAVYERLRKANRNARNLGVKQAPFMVLIGATMPSVLAEISFLTNRAEADLLKTEMYRQQVAEALFAGVMGYQQSLKKPRAVAAN